MAATGIVQLKVRFGGVLVQPAIRLNGAITLIIPHPVSLGNSDGAAAGETTHGEGDLLDEVEKSLEKDSATDQDVEDGPDWMFEEGEKELANPT